MPHPRNRRERFLVGKRKGEYRAKADTFGWSWFRMTEEERLEYLRRWAYLRRDTTKICSCSMCGNPRRNHWEKDGRTMQEKRYCRPWQDHV